MLLCVYKCSICSIKKKNKNPTEIIMKETILTGKALDDFKIWAIETYTKPVYVIPVGWENGENYIDQLIEKQLDQYYEEKLPECMILALIQEWLDSVGIYANAIKYNGLFAPIADKQLEGYHIYRNMALKAAIIKANELYNNRL